jgi:tetratricopeptide (TPR) repeat protein
MAALDDAASLERLAHELGQPASARRLAENLYLHTTYGKLALEHGQQEQALSSLERAFKLDPRDREVLTHYGALLRSLGDQDQAVRIDRNLLLHHRRALSSQELARVYRDLGQGHFDQGDLEAARQHFEQALEANASDRAALDLLLKTVEAQGDVELLIRTRQRLLDQMRDPAGRAMLRVAIGDDYRDRLHDEIKAMEAYEAAVEEHPEPEALSRIVDLAGRSGDWHRSALASERMGDLYGQGEQAANSFARAAQLYQHELGNWEKASACYDKALDVNPSDLSHFTELVSLLAGGKQWARLQQAYQRMIERAQGSQVATPELMSALWRKLGEVQRLHTGDPQGAGQAYARALEHTPEDIALHEQLGHLLAESDNKQDRARALEHYQIVMDSAPALRADLLEKLGVLHLRLEDYDAAFCELRALNALGQGNDKTQAFVTEHSRQVLTPLSRELDRQFIQGRIMAPGYEPQLAEVYSLASRALRKLFAHDLERYKLRGRDRIDQNQDLIFNKVYHSVGQLLGYGQRPPVYNKPEVKGMFNAELYPSGFLVGGALLSGANEKEIAFTVAKQLYLFHDESFLTQTRLLGHLQIIFYAMAKAFDGNLTVPCKEDENFRRVVKALRKQEPAKQARFNELMEKVLKLERINLEALQTSFEDTANRVGLLVCDDLDACQAMLEVEPRPINAQRSVEQRMAPLIAWSTSAPYKKLRQTLGLTLG